MFISAASTALIITLPALIATVRRLAMSVTRLPVIVVGRINDPRVANTILVSGKADLIGMARQSLADPETPNKAKEGRFLDIRRCVGCLHGCVGHIDTGRRGTCELNPMIGHEADPDYQIRKTETPKNVLIIGAGPGGLSAAITAAQCGHHVKVYDKDKWVGGSYRIASIPPGKGEIANFCAWQAHTLKKLGVPVILNTEVTKELVEQEQPDVIIAATGVTPIIPKKIPGVDKDLVVLGQDVLSSAVNTGQRVVVAGGGLVGVEVANYLASLLKDVTIVEMREGIALDETPAPRKDLLRDIQRKLDTATVFVSHDLGVVARVADRVAVMYAGKIVEIGTAEEIFYDPRHPYTWALLRALPAFAKGKERLCTIPGTPPTLIDLPQGDAFAWRNEYALEIDFCQAPPLFQVSDTHFAATWLLDPRAPKVTPPTGGMFHG